MVGTLALKMLVYMMAASGLISKRMLTSIAIAIRKMHSGLSMFLKEPKEISKIKPCIMNHSRICLKLIILLETLIHVRIPK